MQLDSQSSRFLHEKITLRRPAHVLMSQRRGIWQVIQLHQFTRVPHKMLNHKHQLPTDWCSCKISGTEDKYFLILVIWWWHLQKKWITRVDPNSGHSDRGQGIRSGQANWARAIGTRYRQVEWNTWNCANGFGCLWSQGLHREVRKQRRLLRKSCSYAWLLKEMLLCSPVRWKLVGSGWWRWDRKVLKVSVAQLFSEVLPLCAA